jgi:HlyD family secretion protein
VKKALGIVALCAALAAAYFLWGRSTDRKTGVGFLTVSVEKGVLSSEVMCTGSLMPVNEVIVGSQVSGTIKELYADFESPVKKDQLVALIDPDLYEARTAQAKADSDAAVAAIAKAEVTYADEMRTLRRQQGLLSLSSISQSAFDTAQTKADAARVQVLVEKAKLQQAQAKLQETELLLKYTHILAPVDGVVTSRQVDVGQTVAASLQAPVMFKIAEDLRRMQVHANVDEADIGRVRMSQRATFTVAAFPDDVFHAVVVQIRNQPKVEQNVVTYVVVHEVNNEFLKLRPGMTANVRILISRADETLMVPEQALRFTPSTRVLSELNLPEPTELKEGEKRVWRVTQGNSIAPVIIRTGMHGTEKVQVFSEDLRPGDKLAVEVSRDAPKSPMGRGLRFM